MDEQRGGERPGPYSGLFGAAPDGYRDEAAPKQVRTAGLVSLFLGCLCVLLAVLTLTSAGRQISEVLTGSPDNAPTAVAAAMVCALVYLLPALYLRKRRRWARYLLIGVAAVGIVGGVMSLPAGILGLAIHATLLLLMLQARTRRWFDHR